MIFEHTRFNHINQLDSESVEQYITALRSLVVWPTKRGNDYGQAGGWDEGHTTVRTPRARCQSNAGESKGGSPPESGCTCTTAGTKGGIVRKI